MDQWSPSTKCLLKICLEEEEIKFTCEGFFGGQLFTESIFTTALLLLDSTSSSTPPTTFLSETEVDHLSFLKQWEKVLGDGLLLCNLHLLLRGEFQLIKPCTLIGTPHTLHSPHFAGQHL